MILDLPASVRHWSKEEETSDISTRRIGSWIMAAQKTSLPGSPRSNLLSDTVILLHFYSPVTIYIHYEHKSEKDRRAAS